MTNTFTPLANHPDFVPVCTSLVRRTGTFAISSYTTGGDTPTSIFPTATTYMDASGISTTGHTYKWNTTSNKVQAFVAVGAGSSVETYLDSTGGVAANASTDQAANAVGGAFVHALADATVTTAITTALTAPNTSGVVGRNVVAVSAAVGGGATFVAGNVIVIGTDQFGNAQTETIALQTGAIASTKFRWTVGAKVFATVTSIQNDTAQPTNSQFSVGIGTKIGTRYAFATPATGDVTLVEKNAVAATYTADATAMAVLLSSNTAANDEVTIQYNRAASLTEAASTANVGSLVAFFDGY